MVVRRATSTRKTAAKATKAPAKATAKRVKATAAPTGEVKKSRKPRVDYGVKARRSVKSSVNFPARTRTSTKQSPYADDIAGLIGQDHFIVFDGVTSQEEFTSFANTLRNVAKRLFDNRRLQIVWVETDTPTNPSGVYVKDGGQIQARERKAKA